MTEQDPPPEPTWTFRRVFTYAATAANSALLAAIVLRLQEAEALRWVALALVGANVVLATLYLAGASVLDWARLAAAAGRKA
ncbi:hypothetical protein [Caulobacter sp. 17J65-9]|uniref:hypothetical protein n=1 Tax=Caulobacter sp. 17J65-9 TaxID=2709382 RepID=UPI0013CC2B32|nr:hypothetical protein [Caulobacter sp. 17J65-9]NEX94845.1 hypothetical protein [Caulobacter sp. 17J65-9]